MTATHGLTVENTPPRCSRLPRARLRTGSPGMVCISRVIPKRCICGSRIISKPVTCLSALPVAARAFPPEAQEAVLETVHQSPQQQAEPRSRWTLALLRKHCPLLQPLRSLSGVWRALRRLRIRWKRGRSHLTSPDRAYASKCRLIACAFQQASEQPEQVSILYGDETTVYRQPTVGQTWHEAKAGGKHQPRAVRSFAKNATWRISGTLDAQTGRVISAAGNKMGVKGLVAFLQQLRTAYGQSRRLLLVWDNWPVHYHPTVLAAAAEERIELLWLPTYAPWLNPIEKLWRKLKEEQIALHRQADNWQRLKDQCQTFLSQYDRLAPDLLRYVGM